MAVPKKKTSRARRDKRRTHDALTPIQVGKCKRCGDATLPHRACPTCGYYKDTQVIAPSDALV